MKKMLEILKGNKKKNDCCGIQIMEVKEEPNNECCENQKECCEENNDSCCETESNQTCCDENEKCCN